MRPGSPVDSMREATLTVSPQTSYCRRCVPIFNAIDAICTTHDVIKIKTIGDSYMCFRGDADASTNARSVARVALDVLQVAPSVAPSVAPGVAFKWPNGETIRFRAGIHIGPATAGVIGTQRLQYDVWGDTVNVASRMESTGEPGRIHVSDAFAQHLAADALTLIPRGLVDIKGKGAMQTYWLELA
jgi:adenylate cyclase